MTSNRIIITGSDRQTFGALIFIDGKAIYSSPFVTTIDEAQKLLDQEWERLTKEGEAQ
jgi:hypothetical protein